MAGSAPSSQQPAQSPATSSPRGTEHHRLPRLPAAQHQGRRACGCSPVGGRLLRVDTVLQQCLETPQQRLRVKPQQLAVGAHDAHRLGPVRQRRDRAVLKVLDGGNRRGEPPRDGLARRTHRSPHVAEDMPDLRIAARIPPGGPGGAEEAAREPQAVPEGLAARAAQHALGPAPSSGHAKPALASAQSRDITPGCLMRMTKTKRLSAASPLAKSALCQNRHLRHQRGRDAKSPRRAPRRTA